MNNLSFSDRYGYTSPREVMQIESIDIKLQNRLWNCIYLDFFLKINNNASRGRNSRRAEICRHIWADFYNHRIDEVPRYHSGNIDTIGTINYIKLKFNASQWYDKYNLIEYLSNFHSMNLVIDFDSACNGALKRELAGYRIIDSKVVQITSEEEVAEIEEALTDSSEWKPVNTHLSTALKYFSDRKNPNYRNSIKESISAVESLCAIITKNKKATLGDALKIIESKYKIHGALKSAFASLYGYTSDSGGIRHKLLEDDIEVSMEDAKFMLVSCSAFINYLKVKIEI